MSGPIDKADNHMADTELTWDDVQAKRSKRWSVATICMDNDALSRMLRLHAELEQLAVEDAADESLAEGRAQELAREVERLRVQAKASEVEVRFAEIGKGRWQALKDECPPSDAQREAGHTYDPQAFIPKAIAASCVSPAGLTEAKAREILAEWGAGAGEELWQACLDANMAEDTIPFSVTASAVIQRSERKRTTPASEESLSPPSEGE